MSSDVDSIVDMLVTGDDTAYKIRQCIDQAFFDEYEALQKKHPRDGLHASTLKESFTGKGQYCYKQHTLNKYFLPDTTKRPIAIETIRQYKLGWYIHLMFQKLFTRAGYALEVEETRVDSKYGVYYTTDIIARFPNISQQRYVVEIKSMNAESFRKAVLLDDPLRSHREAYKQLQIYMFLTNVDQSIQYVNKGIILIYNKDTSDFYHWLVNPDEAFLAPYIERLEKQVAYYAAYEKTGKHATRVCDNASSPRAKACPMGYLCWMTGEERKQFQRSRPLEKRQKNVSMMHEA